MCFFSVALIMFVRSTSVCKGPSTGEQKVQKDFYLAIFTLHASFWINRSNNRLILLSPRELHRDLQTWYKLLNVPHTCKGYVLGLSYSFISWLYSFAA